MSLYQFFASNKQLEIYDNNRIVLDSEKGILKGRNDKMFTSDELSAMRIFLEDDITYMRLYTDKKYGAFIEWYYSDKNAEIILKYIRKHLKGSREIELWNVWLGQRETARVIERKIDDLTVSDIKNIWGKEFFEFSECLKVYR